MKKKLGKHDALQKSMSEAEKELERSKKEYYSNKKIARELRKEFEKKVNQRRAKQTKLSMVCKPQGPQISKCNSTTIQKMMGRLKFRRQVCGVRDPRDWNQ